MARLSVILTALAAFLCPATTLADVPGRPPAVEPDCPPGTRLEGPYAHWQCVPTTPEDGPQEDPLAEDPAAEDPPADAEDPAAEDPPLHATSLPGGADVSDPPEPEPSGCACRVRASQPEGGAWLAVVAAFWLWRRRS